MGRPSSRTGRAFLTMEATARPLAPRSTAIMRALAAYQPQMGIHRSSRFRMIAGSLTRKCSFIVSQADWCLAARRKDPLFGTCSRPRTS